MIKKYFEAIHPARDGRAEIAADEGLARVAALLIHGQDDWIWHAERQIGPAPALPASARINARRRAGGGEWIEVRAPAAWWDELRAWYARAVTADSKEESVMDLEKIVAEIQEATRIRDEWRDAHRGETLPADILARYRAAWAAFRRAVPTKTLIDQMYRDELSR